MATINTNLAGVTSGSQYASAGDNTIYTNLPYNTAGTTTTDVTFIVGASASIDILYNQSFKVDSTVGFHELFGNIEVQGVSSDYTVSSWYGKVVLTHKTTGQVIQFQLTKPENPASNSGVNVEFLDGAIAFTSNVNGQGVWTVWATTGGTDTSTWGQGGYAAQVPGTYSPGATPLDLSEAAEIGFLNYSVNSSDITNWSGNPTTYTLTTNIDTINVTGTDANTVQSGLIQGTGASTGSTWNTGDAINGNGLTEVSLLINSVSSSDSNSAVVDANDIASINVNLVSGGTGSTVINMVEMDNVAQIAITKGVGGETLYLANAQQGTTYKVAGTQNVTVASWESGTGSTTTANLSAVGATGTFDVTASNTTEIANLATSGTNAVTVNGGSGLATLKVTGNGTNTLTVGTSATALTLDASASTGTNTLNLGTGLSSTDVIKGGTGADTLQATLASAIQVIPTITGVEALDLTFSAAAIFNASKVTGAEVLTITPNSSVSTAVTVSNLNQNVDLINFGKTSAINASGAISLGYASGSKSDVLVDVSASSSSSDPAVSIGALALTNNTGNLDVVSNGDATNTIAGINAGTFASVGLFGGTQELSITNTVTASSAADIVVDATLAGVSVVGATDENAVDADNTLSTFVIAAELGNAIVNGGTASSGTPVALSQTAATGTNIATTYDILGGAGAISFGYVGGSSPTFGDAMTITAAASGSLTADINVLGAAGAINIGDIVATAASSSATNLFNVDLGVSTTSGNVVISGLGVNEGTAGTSSAVLTLGAAGGDITLGLLDLGRIDGTTIDITSGKGDAVTIQSLEGTTVSSTDVSYLSSITASGVGDVSLFNTASSASAATNITGNAVIDTTGLTGNFTLNLGGQAQGSSTVLYTALSVGNINIALGNAASGKSNTVYTGSGTDVITGGTGVDVVSSGAGADSVSVGAGNDTVIGGLGADTIDVGTGTDTITYLGFTDTLNSGSVWTSPITVTAADIVSGMGNGDIVDLTALNLTSVTTVGTALTTSISGDAVNLVRGTYNGTTFTVNSSGDDYFLEIVDDNTTDILAGVVLVDITGTVTATITSSDLVTLSVA